MKKVSVVILNWNGAALLRNYLPSVITNTDPSIADVVVADNGSTDESLEVLRTEFPQVKVIAMPENSGFAEGYNIALKQIETEYAVLLNSDVEVAPYWLEPMLDYAESHREVAAIQPKILSCRDRCRFEHAGAAGGYLDKYGFPFCRGRIFDSVEEDNGQYNAIIDIFWASGACLFTRLSDYNAAGGLDRLFFAHMEEIDLCWRYHLAGKRVVCIPQSTVYHLGGATLDVDNPRKTYLNFRNNLLMLYKNLPLEERRNKIFKRKLIDGIAAVGFILKRKPQNVRAIINAHSDADEMIRTHYSKLTPTENPEILSRFYAGNRSVILAYFVKGKKRFSDLF
ncbi:MAG: glycosyltransferase family 2 protein [Bacteroidales bacterium]